MATEGAQAPPAPDRRALTAFAGAVLIGGTNFVGVRLSNRELDPLWGAALRFAIAAAVFAVICLSLRLRLPRGRTLALVVAYGLLGFGAAYGLLYVAMLEVSAGVAAVVMAMGPLLTLMLAVAHRLEKFSARAAAGAVIAVGGSVLAFLRPGQPVDWMSLLLLGGAALCAAESMVVSKLCGRQHPAVMNLIGMSVATLALLLISRLAGEHWALPEEGTTQIALAYLVAGTVGLFVLVLVVVQRWTASATAYLFVLMPIVAALVGALVADEPITTNLAVGAVVVFLGVYVGALSRTQRRQLPPATTPPS